MSRFRNKQLYTDVFPEFTQKLIGTEYSPIQPPLPVPFQEKPVKSVKERFGEATPFKKTLMTPPVQPTQKPDIPIQPYTQPTAQTVSLKGYVAENKYDTSLQPGTITSN